MCKFISMRILCIQAFPIFLYCLTILYFLLGNGFAFAQDQWIKTPLENSLSANPEPPALYPNAPLEANQEFPGASQMFPPSAMIASDPLRSPNPQQKEEKHEPYRLRIGDLMTMAIYGEPDTQRKVIVDVTGCISYLFINCLQGAGKTIDEVRHEMEARLKTYYRHPILIITASETVPNFFTILGEVRDPGSKPIEGNMTVLSAICAGGGFNTRIYRNQTLDVVDLEHSFIAREGEYLPVNFERLLKYGDPSQDIPLRHGDYIYMASSSIQKVFVLGEVFYPATVEIIDTITLAQALAAAGGLTRRSSSRVVVLRGSLACPVYYYIDVNRILKGTAYDFRLVPGDIVYVPQMKFTLLKQIIRDGISAFVGIVASIAGTNAFVSITPSATNIIQPVPIINTFGGGALIAPVGGGGVVIP
jgi:polysaccharide biosynthesis/export protein